MNLWVVRHGGCAFRFWTHYHAEQYATALRSIRTAYTIEETPHAESQRHGTEDGPGYGEAFHLEEPMKRFDCALTSSGFDNYRAEMEEDQTGDWVRWEDVMAVEEKINRMKAENGYPTYEDMRSRDGRICELERQLKELDELFQERMLQSDKYRAGLWKLLYQPAFNLNYHQVESVCADAGIYPEPK